MVSDLNQLICFIVHYNWVTAKGLICVWLWIGQDLQKSNDSMLPEQSSIKELPNIRSSAGLSLKMTW